MFTNPTSANHSPPISPSVAGFQTSGFPKGFTLIEVVIALTILSMMTGTLFAIIQGSVRAAAQIEGLQRENDSINRLLDVLRKTFSTLPSAATVTLVLTDQNASETQELTITGAPNTFGFGPKPISYSPTIISLRPDLQGRTDENDNLLYNLSISRTDLIPQTDDSNMAIGKELDGVLAQDEQGRNWMPLLPEVTSLKWRFYKLADETWNEEWSESNWPDLIEIQLLMRERTFPIRMVFSLPTLNLTTGTNTLPAPAPTTPTSTSTSTTSTQQQAPAGNAQPGSNQAAPAPQGGSR
jgi:prepilin-type N-terminal cleavage/methylation domain-containing protein